MAVDTIILRQKPFKEALDKLEELLSHSKPVLLGTGASCCAGLRLTNQLTEKSLTSEKPSNDSKRILAAIQISFTDAKPAAHIEDYLSELLDWLAISGLQVVPDDAGLFNLSDWSAIRAIA